MTMKNFNFLLKWDTSSHGRKNIETRIFNIYKHIALAMLLSKYEKRKKKKLK